MNPLKHRLSLVALAVSTGLAPAVAQQGGPAGLNWITQRPGSSLDSQSRAQVEGNTSRGGVTAAGGRVGAVLGLAADAQASGVAQVNGVSLTGIDARSSQLWVLRNQTTGLVNALGGQAAVNAIQLTGAAGRQPLADSQLVVSGNKASDIEAMGGQASLVLGAGSLQAVGRAGANSVLIDDSPARDTRVTQIHNEAAQMQSMGGSALAQALTASRSQLDALRVVQSHNQARDVIAGGGSAGLGWGAVAKAELSGVAAANSALIANSNATGATVQQQRNEVRAMSAVGGFAMANSLNLADYQGGDLRQYLALHSGNTARDVLSRGASASIAGGALADMQVAATALANSISIQQGQVGGATRHVLQGNTAEGVRAVGGGAAGNSIWLADARTEGSDIHITSNTARDLSTASGSASLGGGNAAEFERNGRALGNSVALAAQARLAQSPITLHDNQATGVRGAGGLAAANSVVAMGGRVQNTPLNLSGNTVSDVQAQGFSGSAGGGLLFSASQNAMALANSLGVFDATVDGGALDITGNTARSLSAQGGKLLANSVSAEGSEGEVRLSARTSIAGNTAERLSTGASRMAGPGNAFSAEKDARVAANAVVLRENVQVDGGSPLQLRGNRASQVSAVGGTALVNALAAYRGARISGSPITLADNRAQQISTGGGYNQVAAVGSAKNGILVANGVYLEGESGVRLSGSPITLRGNVAQSIEADGGRVNANAFALNGQGQVQGNAVTLGNNTAERVRSQGSQRTVAGMAIDREVGHANANAVQVMGALRGGSTALTGNTARDVQAEKGLAQANSFTQEQDGSAQGTSIAIAGNTAEDVRASDRKSAAANSVQNQGRISGSSVAITTNRGGARASRDDAQVNSLRNREGASVAGSAITILGNHGNVTGAGSLNSVDNSGTIGGSNITIANNRGSARDGGLVNSVGNSRSIAGSNITILGNQGSAERDGTVNSVANSGRISGSNITIAANKGSASRGGTVNSVSNRGTITGTNITIAGNDGSASRGGTVNSVDNRGTLTGSVVIAGNRGSSNGGGTVNSVVNHGLLAGKVVIAANNGSASMGGTANSVINRGVITGAVTIVGNASNAGVGRTVGSVRTTGGVIAGAAGVTGGAPWAANLGYTIVKPGAVVSRSVTVGPAVTVLNM